MCGIYARLAYYESRCTLEKIKSQLIKLKHRGSDGIGMAIDCKENMVVIKQVDMNICPKYSVMGDMGVGHVRYRTKGKVDNESCQPLIHENIALVHNGHIASTDYSPDSYLLLVYFQRYPGRSVLQIVSEIFRDVRVGSYSCIVMIRGVGLVAFRDPRGIRPLVYHQNKDRLIIASESCVISEDVTDVKPGECIIFGKDGSVTNRSAHPKSIILPVYSSISISHTRTRSLMGFMFTKHDKS